MISTNPANGSTVTVTPSAITVTFNKPVNFSTVSAADLTFTGVPAGVTVNLGTPIAVDNPTDPHDHPVPVQLQPPASTPRPTGSYTFSIQSPTSGPVESEDGKNLVRQRADHVHAGRHHLADDHGDDVSGRTVTITFSKAIDPATVTGPTAGKCLCSPPGHHDDVAPDRRDPRQITPISIATRAPRSATIRRPSR